MPSGVRFRPPRVDATPELRWVLLRAFGPPGARGPGWPPAPEEGLRLARRLDLSPRIGARQSRDLLRREAGEEVAAGLRRDRMRTVARSLRLRALADELAAVAAELDLSLICLKFLALDLAGCLTEGSRGAADLDLLLAPGEEQRFADALVARGYASSPMPEMEHQLPALMAPGGGVVEIHRLLPGVRLGPGAASATASDLARAGLLAPAAGLPGGCFVPVKEVLAAHALVHGLAQHGRAPHAYPAMRLVADLVDLGLAGGGEETWDGRYRRWVQPEISPAEVEAAVGLCRRLAAGDLSCLDERPDVGGEAALLHHLLAGALDPDYRSALRLHLLGAPSDRAALAGGAGLILRTLFPGRAELEALYGRPRGVLGRFGQRLFRPLDLGARALRYAASARRLRRRGR